MDDKIRRRMQLDCLYDMFRDRIEENVVYIVYSENEGKIDATIDQLMSISACSFTGHHFEQQRPLLTQQKSNNSELLQSFCYGNRNVGEVHNNSTPIHTQQVKSDELIKNQKYREQGNKDKVDEPNDELTIAERIDELQRSIDDLLLEKKSSHDKASQYLSKKMYPVTSYYSELGSQLRKMIEDKTNQLVNLLLQKSKNSNNIDLHGLNPIQARLVVSELLKLRQNKLMIDKQGEASIDIITGWGKHSMTHGQRIRPTIVALLREKGFEYHHLNKGALRVTIRR